MDSWFLIHIQIGAEINRLQCVNAGVRIYVRISQLCLLRGPRHSDTPVTGTYSASKYHSSVEGIRSGGIPDLEERKYKMSLDYLVVP